MSEKEPFDEVLGDVKPDRVVRLNRTVIILACLGMAALFALALVLGSAPPPAGTEAQVLIPQQGAAPSGVTPTATLQLPKTYGEVAEFNRPVVPPEPEIIYRDKEAETKVVTVVEPSPIQADQVARLLKQVEAIQRANEQANQAAYRAPILFTGSGGAVHSGGINSGGGEPRVAVARPVSALPPDAGRDPFDQVMEASGLLAHAARGKRDPKVDFAATGNGNVKPVLGQVLIESPDPYTLQAGHTIAASLITGINTDLPGRIIAQITEPVYDSVTGKYLLIPQGAKLLGSYDSLIDNGQDRALLVWERMVLPNGKSILLDAMLGTDPTGAAGKKDRVDFHLGRLLGGVVLSTAITYGANSARDRSDNRDEDIIGDSIAQESSRIGGKIVDRILDIEPTIKIRQGARVRVLVEEDIVLEPYRY